MRGDGSREGRGWDWGTLSNTDRDRGRGGPTTSQEGPQGFNLSRNPRGLGLSVPRVVLMTTSLPLLPFPVPSLRRYPSVSSTSSLPHVSRLWSHPVYLSPSALLHPSRSTCPSPLSSPPHTPLGLGADRAEEGRARPSRPSRADPQPASRAPRPGLARHAAHARTRGPRRPARPPPCTYGRTARRGPATHSARGPAPHPCRPGASSRNLTSGPLLPRWVDRSDLVWSWGRGAGWERGSTGSPPPFPGGSSSAFQGPRHRPPLYPSSMWSGGWGLVPPPPPKPLPPSKRGAPAGREGGSR